ncbi:hypothetical protein BH10PLA1_BH10PLA1_00300 [soil metagenome]
MLETRIRQGDYAVRELPTEQELADEVGVSRMTARRALIELMNRGLLIRKPHGKIVVNQEHAQFVDQLRLAFLGPAFSSQDFEDWRFAVDRVTAKLNATVRNVDYVHWDDPAIPQTLSAFDGVFLVLSSEPIPPLLLERLTHAKNLVALGSDLSEQGIPSIRLLPPICVQQLADHLFELGHRNIDCINVQPHDDVIKARIEHWSQWQRIHKVEGRLIDEPVAPLMHPTPKAYAVMKRLLNAKQFKATGLVCITDAAATGAIRALHEAGLTTGKDVSVCSVEGGELGSLQVPSRTMLRPPDSDPYIEVCVDWFKHRNEPWVGPMLIQPANIPLFVGESSGPPK